MTILAPTRWHRFRNSRYTLPTRVPWRTPVGPSPSRWLISLYN
jgi:hypothetical protein